MRYSGQVCALQGWGGGDRLGLAKETGKSPRANKAQHHIQWKSGENVGKEKGLKQQRSGTAPGRGRRAGPWRQTLGQYSVKWKCSHKRHVLLLVPPQLLIELSTGDEAFSD